MTELDTTQQIPVTIADPIPLGPRPRAGQQFGSWQLRRQQAETNFSAVWFATHVETGEAAALKILLNTAGDTPHRFRREVEITERLRGHWLPRVNDHDVEGAQWWVSLEWLGDPTLASLTRDGEPIPQSMQDTFCKDLWQAVEFLREEGVAHRDLQPENVTVSPIGHVRLVDLGLAREADPERSPLTRSSMPRTYGYAAPELITQSHPASWPADLWGWAVLVVLATAGHGVAPTSEAEYVRWIYENEPPDLSGVPTDLLDAVRTCLEKNPTRRKLHAVESMLPWLGDPPDLGAARHEAHTLTARVKRLQAELDARVEQLQSVERWGRKTRELLEQERAEHARTQALVTSAEAVIERMQQTDAKLHDQLIEVVQRGKDTSAHRWKVWLTSGGRVSRRLDARELADLAAHLTRELAIARSAGRTGHWRWRLHARFLVGGAVAVAALAAGIRIWG